ncbi:MAG: CRISPR-associated protein Cas4 [Myxococcota bacterium]
MVEELQKPDRKFITASVLLEYLYCKRFIYFMNCLCIDQNEDTRYKVIQGRLLHEEKKNINTEYLRRRIGAVEKQISVFMSSDRFRIKGEVDEVLTLSDGTMAPLDYKFAEYKDTIFKTHKYQIIFYGLLIRETFNKEVNRGYIIYTRSKNLLKEISIGDEDFNTILEFIEEIFEISERCYFPRVSKNQMKCIDCCYKNICI